MHGHLGDEAVLLAVFGNQRHSTANGVGRPLKRNFVACDTKRPGESRIDAKQSPQHLGASGSDQAGNADDLARMNAKREAMLRPGERGQSIDFEQHVANLVRAPRVELRNVSPHHQLDHVVVGDLVAVQLAGVFSIAEHRHTVSKFVDLAEAMRNVNDAHALRPQVPHDAEQLLRLVCGQT